MALRQAGTRYEPVSHRLNRDGISEGRCLEFHSPYGCSKGVAEQYVLDYARTFGLRTVVFRMSCIYGPHQFGTEDQGWVAHFLIAALRGDPLAIYGDGLQERDWLFVEDYCRAIALTVDKGKTGEVYNVSAGTPQPNLHIVRTILQHLGKPESLMQYVKDRPGHDRRYALDSSKIQHELGWKPLVSFEEGIRRTIEWYQTNSSWLEHARSGEYRNYYDRHYTNRVETFSR